MGECYDLFWDSLTVSAMISFEIVSQWQATPFTPGDTIYAYLHKNGITMIGKVVEVPTETNKQHYRIYLPNNEHIPVPAKAVWEKDNNE